MPSERRYDRDEHRVRRRDPATADLRDVGPLPRRPGEPERRASEPERQVLDGRGLRVEHEVAAGDTDVDRARPDVHGDVPRAQEEELDVVVRVGQHELAGVATLAVPGLLEHLDGGLGQGALVRDGDPQHGRSPQRWV